MIKINSFAGVFSLGQSTQKCNQEVAFSVFDNSLYATDIKFLSVALDGKNRVLNQYQNKETKP